MTILSQFFYTVKIAENVVKNENKRYFRVQRTRIKNLSALEHHLDICNRFYVNFNQKNKICINFFIWCIWSKIMEKVLN